MNTRGNPAFVATFDLTPKENAFLKMRAAQFPRILREGMNPSLIANLVPSERDVTSDEVQYWVDVSKVSAKEQWYSGKRRFDRPVPPKQLEDDFVKYAESL